MGEAHEKYNYKKEKQAKLKAQVYGKPKNLVKSDLKIEKPIEGKFERKNRSLDPVTKDGGKKEKTYTNFQMLLKERTAAIDNLISSIDSTNNEILNEVDETKYFLEDMDELKQQSKCPIVPGLKINDLMQKWGRDMSNTQTQ